MKSVFKRKESFEKLLWTRSKTSGSLDVRAPQLKIENGNELNDIISKRNYFFISKIGSFFA